MSTAFIWNTGCTAKEPGERSTTPKTETKEEVKVSQQIIFLKQQTVNSH